jgi:hypothetical protein
MELSGATVVFEYQPYRITGVFKCGRNLYTWDKFHHKPSTFTGKWDQTFMPKEVHERRIPLNGTHYNYE